MTEAERVCEVALAYADLGFPVLPIWWVRDGRCGCGNPQCSSPGKHPWGRYAPRGLLDATRDSAVIRSWFANEHVPNIAIRTGRESGLVVVDVDPRNGGNESLESLGDLPQTATVATGGDGRHFIYRCSEPLKGGAHKLGPGIDVKAEGGYIVAPPSNHVSGGSYRWLRDPRGGIAELPSALLRRLKPHSRPERGHVVASGDGDSDDTFLAAPDDIRALAAVCLGLLGPKRCDDYDDWLAVGMVLNRVGLPLEEWDRWSRMNKAKYEPGVCDAKWASFDTDYSGKKLGIATLLQWASQDSGKPVGEILKAAGIKPKTIREGWTDYDQLARRFLKEKYGDCSKQRLVTWNGAFFIWKDGYYIEIDEQRLCAYITTWLSALNGALRKNYGFSLSTSASFVRNILHNVVAQTLVGSHVTFNSWLDGADRGTVLSLANGLLFLDKRDDARRPVLREHDSDYFTTVRLPYPYDPEAACPNWLAFLAQTLRDEEYIRLVQQFAGYLLMPTLKYRKFLLGLGEGATGKGTLVSTLCAMVGEENVSGVPLHQFGQRFGLTPTLGKALNWCDETVHFIDPNTEETLKAFVAGTSMTFDRKNRDAIFASPTAKVIITSNSEPRWNDRSMGTWDRVLLVPFEHRVEEDDRIPDLGDKLKQELPGILNWAIVGMDDLEHNGGFVRPGRNDELLAQYRCDCDPARAFLLDNYTFSPNAAGCLPKQSVYKSYRDFCERTGCKPLYEGNFSKVVFQVFPQCRPARKRLGGRDRVHVYDGLVATTEGCVPLSQEDWL